MAAGQSRGLASEPPMDDGERCGGNCDEAWSADLSGAVHVDALPSRHRDARRSLLIERRTARRWTSIQGFDVTACSQCRFGYESRREEIVIPIA